MKKITLLFLAAMSFTKINAQITATAAHNSATGTVVTVNGIVTNGSELGTTTRYFQDATGGIAAYSGTQLTNVKRGDSVSITGSISNFNGLIEIVSPSFSASVIASGKTVPAPLVTSAIAGFVEANESRLIRINNVTFSAAGTFAGNTNYTFTHNGTQEDIRINNSSNLVGTTIPVGPVDIIGILSEYNVGTYTGTSYQLLLRDLNDIVYAGNPPLITTSLRQSNITITSFDVSFLTQKQGSTIVKYGLTPTALTSSVSSATMTTNHNASLTGLTPATVYYVQGLTISATNDTSFSAVTAMATASNSSGKIKVYFNRSVNNNVAHYGHLAQQLNGTFDDTLIAYINRAVSTLDIAIYNVDNNLGVISAVNAATARGVNVRVICDFSVGNVLNSFTTPNKKLAPAGTTLYGIMHNKFMVIDVNDPNLATVWTGSTNWTDQQLLTDANNVIIIQDQSLARGYTIEFEEMFTNYLFGASKKNNTPHDYMIGGKHIESYFSPSDNTHANLKRAVATANYDLYAGVMSWTKTDIGYVIIDSAINKNGAYYAGIVDDTSGTGAAAPFNNFYNKGITTQLIDKGSYIFHHKYAIIDPNDACSDPMVTTGSHNWSTAADTKNDENELFIHDSTTANMYYQEFSQRYADLNGTLLNKVYKSCPKGVGVETIQTEGLNLFPNPATDQLFLVHANLDNQPMQVLFTDMSGRVVKQERMISNTHKQILDVNSLTPGVYMITVMMNNQVQSFKLIKE